MSYRAPVLSLGRKDFSGKLLKDFKTYRALKVISTNPERFSLGTKVGVSAKTAGKLEKDGLAERRGKKVALTEKGMAELRKFEEQYGAEHPLLHPDGVMHLNALAKLFLSQEATFAHLSYEQHRVRISNLSVWHLLEMLKRGWIESSQLEPEEISLFTQLFGHRHIDAARKVDTTDNIYGRLSDGQIKYKLTDEGRGGLRKFHPKWEQIEKIGIERRR